MQYPDVLPPLIARGKYVVLPTDTIYGIVASALDTDAVEGLYNVRKRAPSKPFIILISDVAQLELFGIDSEKYKNIVRQYWPGPVSIILPCLDEKVAYLHRGTHALAFRLPAREDLRELIQKTGPLVAPSANHEGMPPATRIDEAKAYFGDQVAQYVDGGEIRGTPSAIISIGEDGSITKIR